MPASAAPGRRPDRRPAASAPDRRPPASAVTAPRRPDRRRIALVAGIAAAALLVYGVVVALYAADERSRLGDPCTPAAGQAVVTVTATSVDALRDRIGITLDLTDAGPLKTGGLGFSDEVTIVVDGTDTDRTFTIPAGTIPGAVAASLITDGQIEQWPFDAHTSTARFALLQTADGQPAAYLPDVCLQGQVAGWTLSASTAAGSDDLLVDDQPVPTVILRATRSPATVAFGLVLLALMTALPVLGLTVAIAAFRGRRKVEATLMSWMAAMLFAVVPLRGFLPGSPPVGSWVDYLVVLWVVAGLVSTLVVYVLAWLRWTPAAGERPLR